MGLSFELQATFKTFTAEVARFSSLLKLKLVARSEKTKFFGNESQRTYREPGIETREESRDSKNRFLDKIAFSGISKKFESSNLGFRWTTLEKENLPNASKAVLTSVKVRLSNQKF